jgi:molybdopterin converting factor small subunit
VNIEKEGCELSCLKSTRIREILARRNKFKKAHLMIERFNKKNSKKQQILQKGDIVSFFPLYLCCDKFN